MHDIPKLRSPKLPFSFKYWLNRLHVSEKLGFPEDDLRFAEHSIELGIVKQLGRNEAKPLENVANLLLILLQFTLSFFLTFSCSSSCRFEFVTREKWGGLLNKTFSSNNKKENKLLTLSNYASFKNHVFYLLFSFNQSREMRLGPQFSTVNDFELNYILSPLHDAS